MQLARHLACATFIALAGFGSGTAAAWDLPPDKGLMGKDTIAAILAANDYAETSSFRQAIEFLDFTANGKSFTQVVVTLTPDKPRLQAGKKLVVVGGEPGSEYAMDFVKTVEGKEGPGVWLAKRGVTFVALTRIGRWNFLAPEKDGSWGSVPMGERMPMFNREQKQHWPAADYQVVPSGTSAGTAASASVSSMYRFPKDGTELQKYMIALTGKVYIEGYRLALEKAITDRQNAKVLFWGMSTGGSSLYPLAKYYTPDGFLNWGTSTTGLASAATQARRGNFNGLYEKSALRVRERGLDDFEFYTKTIDAETKAKWWKAAQSDPRFKSTEDAPMALSAAAMTEHAFRLWFSDFLPAKEREKGLAAFVQDFYEPSFPPAELKKVPVLELNGTEDEVLPPATVDSNRALMEPYTKKYRVGRIDGFHHYLFTVESVKVVGTTWLRFIESGYFD